MRAVGRLFMFAAMFVLLTPSLARAQSDAGWDWDIVLYLWMSDITIDVADERNVIEFRDLVDKLELAGQVHFEGHSPGRGGFFADLTYISLSDEQTIIGHPELPDGTLLGAEVTSMIAELGGLYTLGDEQAFDILLGARLIDMDNDIVLTPPGFPPQPQETPDTRLTDGFIGGRLRGPVGGRWSYWIRGDVGTGDTDLTWNVAAGLGFGVGKKGNKALMFGYRHLQAEVEEAEGNVEFSFSGPAIAFKWTL